MSKLRSCDRDCGRNCGQCPAYRRECEGCTAACSYSQCNGQCAQCAVHCHRRVDLDDWLAAIGGLDLDMRLRPQARTSTAALLREPYFPQLLNQLEIPSALHYAGTIGVGIAKVLTPRGKISRRALPQRLAPRDLKVQWRIPKPELTELVCIGNHKDAPLEQLWEAQSRENIWGQIQALGFDYATSLNFSIYFDEPRMEHLINIKRTWLSVQRIQETSSLIAVPHLQWATELDLARQLDFAQAQGFHSLTMNLQMAKRQGWEIIAKGLAHIQERAPNLGLLFTGVVSLKRMAALAHAFPDACFTNANAHYLAQRRILLDRDGTRVIKVPVEAHPDLILGLNMRFYRDFLAERTEGRAPVLEPILPEEGELRTAFLEVAGALQSRFGYSSERAIEIFDLLATDPEILDAFVAWLRTDEIDYEFQGSFPTWPCAEQIPQPSMGELLDRWPGTMTTLDAFLHLADLAHQVYEEIQICSGQAGV